MREIKFLCFFIRLIVTLDDTSSAAIIFNKKEKGLLLAIEGHYFYAGVFA
jgi:hypothetical protein